MRVPQVGLFVGLHVCVGEVGPTLGPTVAGVGCSVGGGFVGGVGQVGGGEYVGEVVYLVVGVPVENVGVVVGLYVSLDEVGPTLGLVVNMVGLRLGVELIGLVVGTPVYSIGERVGYVDVGLVVGLHEGKTRIILVGPTLGI